MSTIESISGSDAIKFQPQRPPRQGEGPQMGRGGELHDRPNLTKLGSLFSLAENADKKTKGAFASLNESLQTAVSFTSMDVDSIFDSISEDIKTFAEKAGIDLKSAIQEFADMVQMNSLDNLRPRYNKNTTTNNSTENLFK